MQVYLIKKMKLRTVLIILFFILVIVILVKPLFNLYRLSPYFDYPDGYKSLSVKIGENTLTYINGESVPEYFDMPPCINNVGSNITIYLSKPWSLHQVFRIKSNLFCVYNVLFDLRYVDGDGEKEIWSEWIATAGGSWGSRIILIWDVSQGNLKPKYKYPEELVYDNNQEDKIILSDEGGKKVYEYLSIGDNSYYNFKSENGKLYLDLAYFIWNTDEGESHFSAHKWALTRYVLSDDTFVRDEKWNKGKEYITESKMEIYDDNLNAEISSLFEKIK